MNAANMAPPISPSCPLCHVAVKPTDYFCPNCGKSIKPKPISTSLLTQLGIYAGSVLLPPLGFFWGIRYLRQPGRMAKIIGSIAIVLTIITIYALVQISSALMKTLTQEMKSYDILDYPNEQGLPKN